MSVVFTLLQALSLLTLQVDLRLEPGHQSALVGGTIFVDLVASAADPEPISAVDAILAWDPARLALQGASVGAFPSFVSGFLPDPDGINLDLDDGEVLYTVLMPPSTLASVPPDLVIATFEFQVLSSACVALAPSAGIFGSTRVIGAVPGVEVTGSLAPGVVVEVPGTWSLLGHALAGTGGLLPTLEGDGALLPCDPWVLSIDDALPSSTSFVVLGFSQISLPLKGGLLVPAPDIVRSFPIGPTGARVLSGSWPAGLPGGVEISLQAWILDPGGSSGFSSTNAVLATTP
ncbi:MAG: hypothetical protein DHS20C15_30780 [Planctomycetota bacterium]|nr:MAG: hypothetical protein DHS20C15_30780 [Planctomycetota bacterium]